MPLTRTQIQALLAPLDPGRVRNRAQAGQTLSYLESWDVRRWLIRIFGHAGWTGEADDLRLIHERGVKIGQRQADGFSVAYSCAYTLIIKDPGGAELARYREYASSASTGSDLSQCHDTAIKSAESDALKRCAINLGDTFGLSLYEDGSIEPIVNRTLPADEVERCARAARAEQPERAAAQIAGAQEPPEADHDEDDVMSDPQYVIEPQEDDYDGSPDVPS